MTTKRVLFLDDDQGRLDAFTHNHQGRTDLKIQWAETELEAILSMKERHFTAILLDHDLGEFGGSNGMNAGTGMGVVDWMIENLQGDDRPDLVVVHSWNPVRAPEMVDRLREAGFNVVRHMFDGSLRLS